MKKVTRKNQIIITALAVMIAVAGYLSFTNKDISIIDEEGDTVAVKSTDDVQETMQNDSLNVSVETGADAANEAVNEEPILTETISETAALTSASEEGTPVLMGAEGNSDDAPVSAPVNDTIGEAVLTNAITVTAASNAIVNAKLNREQTRSKSQELLMQLVNNENLDEASKQTAAGELVAMTARMEKESVCEQQLLAKGFGECVVLISEDSVDVTVNRAELSEVEKAQIEDILTRKAECDVSQITITTVTE